MPHTSRRSWIAISAVATVLTLVGACSSSSAGGSGSSSPATTTAVSPSSTTAGSSSDGGSSTASGSTEAAGSTQAAGSSEVSGSTTGSATSSPSATGTSGAASQGCPIATPPAGASSTTITDWVDPRPCAWKESFADFAPATTGDGSLKAVQQKGTLTICAETDIKPIVYKDPKTGETSGFEVDIANEMAQVLGIAKIAYVNIPFVSYIPALQAKKCDIVMGGIAITSERAAAPTIKYAGAYFRYADVVVVRKDSPYQSVNDLAGKTFASVPGSVEDTETKQMQASLGHGTKVKEYTEITSTYISVANGTDDALVDLNATWSLHPQASVLRALPGLVKAADDPKSPYYPGSGAVITRSTEGDLNAAVTVALAQLVADGSVKKILTKWNLYSDGVTDFIRPVS